MLIQTALLSIAQTDVLGNRQAGISVSWKGFTTCLHKEAFKFDAPLLIVAGEQNTRGTIQKHLPDWKVLYPDCMVKTIPNAGHVANLDQQDLFNKLLLSFINDCERVRLHP